VTFSEGSDYEKRAKAPQKKLNKQTAVMAPVFTKKENSTLAQRIEILDWYHKNGRNQTATAQHFSPLYPNLKLKQPLISSWIKEEPKFRKQWENGNHQSDWKTK